MSVAWALSVFLIVLAAILILNNGHFTYSLDDPYIHLALAENIARGHYGVNLEELSSPSSSIIFPFLLALLLQLGFGGMAPLALNLLCLLLTTALLWTVFARHVFAGLPQAAQAAQAATAVSVMALLCLNGIGVAFTGMEHSLHILATVAAGLGMILTDKDQMPRWLPFVLIGQILIRFEGGAIFAAALVVLIYYRHWGAAAIAAIGAILAVGIYAGAMVSAGLPALPSSVATKSTVAGAAMELGSLRTIAAGLYWNIVSNLRQPAAVALHLFTLIALWFAVWTPPRLRGRPRIFLLAMLVAIMAHDVAGQYGWFSRYELYILFFSLVIGAYAFAPYLRMGVLRTSPLSVAAVVASALVLSLYQGPYVLVRTVRGANNIHEQQYQLHRFAAGFYKNAVAVNDLGYVSYDNDAFVLDLWGLGSERARLARRQGGDGWMTRIVDDHKVGLALIYEDWFNGMIPATWTKVAELRLGHPRDSVARDTVAFFVTRSQDCTDVVDKVRAFQPTLPAGVMLTTFDAACRR